MTTKSKEAIARLIRKEMRQARAEFANTAEALERTRQALREKHPDAEESEISEKARCLGVWKAHEMAIQRMEAAALLENDWERERMRHAGKD